VRAAPRVAVALAGLLAAAAATAAGPPFPGAAFAVLPHEAALEAFLDRLPPAAARAVRERLPEGGPPVVVAYLGTAPTAGYSVRIGPVRIEASRLVVTLGWETPPPDAMVAQVLTHPVAVRRLERLPPAPYEVRFLGPDGRPLTGRRAGAARPGGCGDPRPPRG